MNRRTFVVSSLSTVIFATGLAGCDTTYKPAPAAFHAVLEKPYRLNSGDRLRITVFGQGDLTNSYSVDKSGYIAFPLVGSIAARGHTIKAVEDEIAKKLAQDYLRNPDVSVEVEKYRPFFIMGQVAQPGQYTYVPGMTVQNAIAIAGGHSSRGDQRSVDITRNVNGEILTGRVPITDPILAGDTLFIRERAF